MSRTSPWGVLLFGALLCAGAAQEGGLRPFIAGAALSVGVGLLRAVWWRIGR